MFVSGHYEKKINFCALGLDSHPVQWGDSVGFIYDYGIKKFNAKTVACGCSWVTIFKVKFFYIGKRPFVDKCRKSSVSVRP